MPTNDRFALFMNIAAKRSLATSLPPADCVRQFPTTNPETTELVGFDGRGVARIKVEIPKDEDIVAWSAYIMRWVRRREQRDLRAQIRVV